MPGKLVLSIHIYWVESEPQLSKAKIPRHDNRVLMFPLGENTWMIAFNSYETKRLLESMFKMVSRGVRHGYSCAEISIPISANGDGKKIILNLFRDWGFTVSHQVWTPNQL